MSARVPLLGIGIVAAMAATMPDARAQCRLCSQPTTTRAGEAGEDVVSLQIQSKLDFDRLVFTGPGSGSATLRPDGSTSVSGGIAAISGRAMVGQAVVQGQPGRAVRIDLPPRIDLYSVSGSRISIDDVISDLSAAPRLDSAGRLSFRFGGKLAVSGEAEGDYRGDIPITVEYL